jgi:hypothetical protein
MYRQIHFFCARLLLVCGNASVESKEVQCLSLYANSTRLLRQLSQQLYISVQVSLRLSQEQGTTGTTTMLKFSVRFLSPSRKFLSSDSD